MKSRPEKVFSRVMLRVVGVLVNRSGAGARRWERRRAMGWDGGERDWLDIVSWFAGYRVFYRRVRKPDLYIRGVRGEEGLGRTTGTDK